MGEGDFGFQFPQLSGWVLGEIYTLYDLKYFRLLSGPSPGGFLIIVFHQWDLTLSADFFWTLKSGAVSSQRLQGSTM